MGGGGGGTYPRIGIKTLIPKAPRQFGKGDTTPIQMCLSVVTAAPAPKIEARDTSRDRFFEPGCAPCFFLESGKRENRLGIPHFPQIPDLPDLPCGDFI